MNRADLRDPDLQEIFQVANEGLEDLEEVVILSLLCYFAAFRDDRKVNHVLLEGINGTSKTRLAGQVNKALLGPALASFYKLIGWDPYQRTAGSPDQTPADIVGGDVLGPGGSLVFRKGPILQRCLMYYADELNRSPPKTQAALLEAMAEQQVTINTLDPAEQANRIIRLPRLFIFASQNPESHEGTFPLPEAQLDRFMCMIFMPYTANLKNLIWNKSCEPDENLTATDRLADSKRDREIQRFERDSENLEQQLEELGLELKLDIADAVASCREALTRNNGSLASSTRSVEVARGLEELLFDLRFESLSRIEDRVRAVKIRKEVADYIVSIVYWTWSTEAVGRLAHGIESMVSPLQGIKTLVSGVAQGASPRAAIALRDLSAAVAVARGQTEIRKKDVTAVARSVLRHRIRLKFQATMSGSLTTDAIVDAIIRGLGEDPDPPPGV